MKVKIFPKWEGIARKALATLRGLGVHAQLERDGGHVPPPTMAHMQANILL